MWWTHGLSWALPQPGAATARAPSWRGLRGWEGSEHFRSECVHTPTPPSSPILFNRSIYCNLTISPCLRSDATSAAFHCAVQPGPWLRREGAGGGTDPWPPARRREVGPRRRPLRLFFLPLALVTERPGLCTLGILQDWWVTSWACTRPPCLSFVAKRQSAVFLDRCCFPLPRTPVSLCVHTACFTLSLNSSPGLPLPSPGPQAPSSSV